MKIISKRSPESGLSVALDLESWSPQPMVFNDSQKQWEYAPDLKGREVEKIHFKFIDKDGTWFADNNFPKEFDDSGNENNVLYANETGLELKDYVSGLKNEDAGSPSNTPKTDSLVTSKGEHEQKPISEVAKSKITEEDETSASKDAGGDELTDKPKSTVDNEQPHEILGDDDERPNTADTAVTHRSDGIVEYSTFLDRIMVFLKRFIKKWFSFERSSS
ncbi:unnamed protein product [Kluyveromyces dobzhanskii CBS 2104]|uniref:WGS project CCBQ000000000 data, contig 00008 n=1 Tax=Kluyveromyces dobzhanskii CBS 2104 TaxID=1427455 RepID=A0A0A8L7P5_9SACH|nr:unnamed protein product [Kluyveromyces dobzhanskii CBS 2104]